jgi:arginase family enzyme
MAVHHGHGPGRTGRGHAAAGRRRAGRGRGSGSGLPSTDSHHRGPFSTAARIAASNAGRRSRGTCIRVAAWKTSRASLVRFSGPEVRADPSGCAARALAAVTAASDGAVVHFDVDSIDSRDLPLANFPHYNLGMRLATAGEVLPAFYGVPGLRAAVFTEVNPSYEPSGRSLARYVDTVAGALAEGLTQGGPGLGGVGGGQVSR